MEPTAWGAALIVGVFILAAGVACLAIRVRDDWRLATEFIDQSRQEFGPGRCAAARNRGAASDDVCPVCHETIGHSDEFLYDVRLATFRHATADEMKGWAA